MVMPGHHSFCRDSYKTKDLAQLFPSAPSSGDFHDQVDNVKKQYDY
jgi:hypothetical protein